MADKKTPDQIKAEFEAKYGAQASLIAAVPELGDLLTKAIAQNWSADQWKAEYQNTQWYQKSSSAFRDSETSRLSDPGSYADSYNKVVDLIIRTAQSAGLVVDKTQLTHITADQVKTLNTANPISTILSQYWNNPIDSNVLTQYIAQNKTLTSGVLGGTAADNANALRAYAATQGVSSQYLPSGTPGGDYFNNASQAILAGTTTLQKEQELIKQQAMAMYKPFADRIQQGQTVAALASPYINAASNLLEVDPSTIDLSATTGLGNMVTKAIQGDGTNPMTLDTFTTQVKQKPEWLNTSNARNSMMDTATQLLRNFGLVVG